jgi:NAD(P)-dependent dehydrogenase (short-subunit alcohol dehydrogenase family)
MGAPPERRRAVVTGAGSGIGKALVRRLLGEGVEVLAVDINRGSLIQLESSGCETLAADITDPAVRVTVADWPRAQTISSNPPASS